MKIVKYVCQVIKKGDLESISLEFLGSQLIENVNRVRERLIFSELPLPGIFTSVGHSQLSRHLAYGKNHFAINKI